MTPLPKLAAACLQEEVALLGAAVRSLGKDYDMPLWISDLFGILQTISGLHRFLICQSFIVSVVQMSPNHDISCWYFLIIEYAMHSLGVHSS